MATAIARAVYFVASNGTATTVQADRTLVSSLLLCFGGNFAENCSMALDALNVTRNQLRSQVANSAVVATNPFAQAASKPLAGYTSVYSPLASVSGREKLREAVIRNVLANLTLGESIPSPGAQEPFQQCSSDVICRDEWEGVKSCPGFLPTNASVACVGGRCICSTTFYHEAWSTALSFNPRTGRFSIISANGTDPVYTEPFWESHRIYLFTASASLDVAASPVCGLLLTLGALLVVRLAKNKQEVTGKFKLA